MSDKVEKNISDALGIEYIPVVEEKEIKEVKAVPATQEQADSDYALVRKIDPEYESNLPFTRIHLFRRM